MSIDRITVYELTHEEQNTLDVLLTQLKDKLPRNQLRAAYYDGKNAVRDLGISTPPTMRRIASVLGWSAKAVDVLNRRCKLEKFYIPGVTSDDFGIAETWDDNHLDTEAPQAGISSLIHATAFLATTQGDTAAGEPPALITARDGMSGTGEWDRRRRVLKSFLSIIATDENAKPTEMVMYLPNVNVFMTKTEGVWKVERRQHKYGVPVEPLIYQPRLARPFGSSRISRAVMAHQDRATRIVIRSEVTAEFYSAPQRVLLGATEEAFQNPDGSMKTAWQAILGRVWAIGDDDDAANGRADIKEFTQASQQPHMDQLRSEAQLFAGETSIPLASLGISGDANPTSSEAYDAGRDDLFSEAEGTCDGWSLAWRRSMIRALQMRNGWSDEQIPDEAKSLKAKWRDVRTPSRAAAADAASKTLDKFPWLAETELGLELYGFDQSFIDRAMAEKRRTGGSAALRAITAATAAGQPVVTRGSDDAAG